MFATSVAVMMVRLEANRRRVLSPEKALGRDTPSGSSPAQLGNGTEMDAQIRSPE
jgi:hypothetical protein